MRRHGVVIEIDLDVLHLDVFDIHYGVLAMKAEIIGIVSDEVAIRGALEVTYTRLGKGDHGLNQRLIIDESSFGLTFLAAVELRDIVWKHSCQKLEGDQVTRKRFVGAGLGGPPA